MFIDNSCMQQVHVRCLLGTLYACNVHVVCCLFHYLYVHVSAYNQITPSVGEVVSRIKSEEDVFLHSTMGTVTQPSLSALSSDNGGSHESQSLAATYTTLPASCTAEGRRDKNGEGRNLDTIGIDLEAIDVSHDRSTSPLVNEDDIHVPSPTGSSSSGTTLTLTQISDVGGTLSSILNTDKVLVDDLICDTVDVPQNRSTTTTEAVSQPPVNENAVGYGDSVNGVGNSGGGCVKREQRSQDGMELSQRPRVGVDAGQNSTLGSEVVIGDIVRSEMRKILEV